MSLRNSRFRRGNSRFQRRLNGITLDALGEFNPFTDWGEDPLYAYWSADPLGVAAVDSGPLFFMRNSGSTHQNGAYIDPGNGLILPGTTANIAFSLDDAAVDITGNITIICDVTMEDWTPGSTSYLLHKYDAVTQQSYRLMLLGDGSLQFMWSTDGSNSLSLTSTATMSGSGRFRVGVLFQPDNGLGGKTANFVYAAPGENLGLLGSSVIEAGTTSIYSSASTITMGVDLAGTFHSAQIYNGLAGFGGSLAYDADFESQDQDYSSFAEDANSLTVYVVNSTNLVQSDPTKLATYDASHPSYNGAPVYSFSTDDYYFADITDVPQDFYVVVIGNTAGANGTNERIIGFGGGVTGGRGVGDTSTDLWNLNGGTSISGGSSDGDPHLFVGKVFDGDGWLMVDGEVVATGATGNAGLTILTAGCGNNGVSSTFNHLNGNIHTILIFDSDPTQQGQWSRFEEWASRYGVAA